MKIYKCIFGDSSGELEVETQKVIDELFKVCPNGKIEVFNSFGCTNNLKLYNSLIFETEPKNDEFNPLLVHQIIEEFKNG